MVKFEKVHKKYPDGTSALDGVSFHIKPGEFVSIVGQSGTGKTTMVKLINAEDRVTSGQITVGGWNITKIRRSEIPHLRRQIGVVYQDFRLLPKKTVFENVAFALEVCGERRKKIEYIVEQVLKIVGLEGKKDRYPHQLSGGEQQRVAIARSLSHRPKLILADEPTGNLDTKNTEDIIELLVKINQLGTTVILVTHNKSVVDLLKRRVIAMKDGRVVSDEKKGKYSIE